MPDAAQGILAEARLVAAAPAREAALGCPFRCSCLRRGVEAAWVRAAGDLDLAGVPELEAVLQDALASTQLVVLDLSGLTFVDVVGLRVIVDASIRAVCDGQRLVVAFTPGHAERMFRLTGTAEVIERIDLDAGDAASGPRLHIVDADSTPRSVQPSPAARPK